MMTRDGPKVVEFNCRFGDPETEAILPIFATEPSLLELMLVIAHGERLPDAVRVHDGGSAVTTVVATAGYPEAPRTGDAITIPPPEPGILIFHAGTKQLPNGTLVTNGGRVLAITAVGASFEDAQRASRDFASRVTFEGKQFRRDIGWRELARLSATGHAGAA
jgi:phosphoribosylamine--glycine ligase